MNCGENLFVKRLLPAPLSKSFYVMAVKHLPPPAEDVLRQDIEFFEGGPGETFLHKKVSPVSSLFESKFVLYGFRITRIAALFLTRHRPGFSHSGLPDSEA